MGEINGGFEGGAGAPCTSLHEETRVGDYQMFSFLKLTGGAMCYTLQGSMGLLRG
jgi:hypothetical protein